MARKKNFKQGLDNIIQESINLFKEDASDIDPKEVEMLKNRIRQLEKELYLWRTGKLTLENFHESLAKHGLKYNPETNQIEKI